MKRKKGGVVWGGVEWGRERGWRGKQESWKVTVAKEIDGEEGEKKQREQRETCGCFPPSFEGVHSRHTQRNAI